MEIYMENNEKGFFKNAIDALLDKNIPLTKKIPAMLGRHYDLFLYLFVGGLTTILNLVIYYVLVNAANVDPYTSTAIAWFFAMLFAFFINKLWVFNDKSWTFKHAMYQFWTFTAARILSFGMEELLMFLGIELCKINENIVKLPIQILVVLVNYVASKMIIFRKKGKK